MIHDISPAFQRDTLEHGQHGEAEVVKVGDAKVGSVPAFAADHLLAEGGAVEAGLVIARVGDFHYLTWNGMRYRVGNGNHKLFR